MKSFFLPEEPVVRLAFLESENAEMWNGVKMGNDRMSELWNRPEGSRANVIVYTNGDEVELVLNGKSLGRKANKVNDPKMRNQIRWGEIDYRPGTLEAVAYRDGRVVARHKVETTGDPVRLMAEADNAGWQADGHDLQHIVVQAVDKKGRRVLTAQQEVTFSVEGEADIVGVINGDITSDELTIGTRRSLYQGSVTVILRSRCHQPGPVTLTASAPGLKAAKLKLSTN